MYFFPHLSPPAVTTRPKALFTEEDATKNATTYFTEALSSMKDHPMFNLGNTTTLQALALISQLLICIGEPPVQDFCRSTVTALWLILDSDDGKQLKEQAYMNIWVKYHQLRGQLLAKWEELLRVLKIDLNGKHVYTSYQFVLLSVFQYLIEARNAKDSPEAEQPKSEHSLDREEEKVLRCIAGYVPYALLKRMKKQGNAAAAAFCKFLSSWEVAGSGYSKTFLEYTREWIETQNRGGLFKVSDNVYLLFRAMELVSRVFLTRNNLTKLQGVNVQTVLAGKINANKLVQDHWSNLIHDKLNADLSRKFFDVVVNFYIKIRCKAFIKVYLDLKKLKSKGVSKKGEKALRKNLDKNTDK